MTAIPTEPQKVEDVAVFISTRATILGKASNPSVTRIFFPVLEMRHYHLNMTEGPWLLSCTCLSPACPCKPSLLSSSHGIFLDFFSLTPLPHICVFSEEALWFLPLFLLPICIRIVAPNQQNRWSVWGSVIFLQAPPPIVREGTVLLNMILLNPEVHNIWGHLPFCCQKYPSHATQKQK